MQNMVVMLISCLQALVAISLWNLNRWCLKDFYEDKNLFDFSVYSKNSKIFDSVNTKVIVKMKDEF